LYPLTQIYQHEADKKDGVITISYLLGKKGSFVFSGLMFTTAAVLLFLGFKAQDKINHFFLFLLMTFPVVLFFCYWMFKVWRNPEAADFKRSLLMNIISTLCTTAFFTVLIFLNH
jgi:1,4-dihydroxy-2-naphthoate octaprenyltransferase